MSKLSRLLNLDQSLCDYGISRLEKMAGQSGVDVRLMADIIERAHDVMRRLSLDPADTTARELYMTLCNLVRNKSLEEAILLDSDFVILEVEGISISFNLIDIVENVHHELPFDKATCEHARRSLMGELVSRYIDHSKTHDESVIEVSKSIGFCD